jgi:hypothetical protein
MLNKHGQTPLDVCIEDYEVNLERTIEPDGLLSHRNESDLEKGSSLRPRAHGPRERNGHTLNRRGKVADESQT